MHAVVRARGGAKPKFGSMRTGPHHRCMNIKRREHGEHRNGEEQCTICTHQRGNRTEQEPKIGSCSVPSRLFQRMVGDPSPLASFYVQSPVKLSAVDFTRTH